MAIAGSGRRISGVSTATYALQRPHQRRLACWPACPATAGSGTRPASPVSATNIETSTAKPYESTSGRKNDPTSRFQEQHRHHGDDVDQGGVRDRRADLDGRVQHHTGTSTRHCPWPEPSRGRRTTFSTSMMASSTTTPMATTSPASTITLIVAPAASNTSDGRYQRKRDGDQADEGGTPLEQERDNDQHRPARCRAASLSGGCPSTAR